MVEAAATQLTLALEALPLADALQQQAQALQLKAHRCQLGTLRLCGRQVLQLRAAGAVLAVTGAGLLRVGGPVCLQARQGLKSGDCMARCPAFGSGGAQHAHSQHGRQLRIMLRLQSIAQRLQLAFRYKRWAPSRWSWAWVGAAWGPAEGNRSLTMTRTGCCTGADVQAGCEVKEFLLCMGSALDAP